MTSETVLARACFLFFRFIDAFENAPGGRPAAFAVAIAFALAAALAGQLRFQNPDQLIEDQAAPSADKRVRGRRLIPFLLAGGFLACLLSIAALASIVSAGDETRFREIFRIGAAFLAVGAAAPLGAVLILFLAGLFFPPIEATSEFRLVFAKPVDNPLTARADYSRPENVPAAHAPARPGSAGGYRLDADGVWSELLRLGMTIMVDSSAQGKNLTIEAHTDCGDVERTEFRFAAPDAIEVRTTARLKGVASRTIGGFSGRSQIARGAAAIEARRFSALTLVNTTVDYARAGDN
ncbi:MAG TPA: hypothetical protein PKM48_02860 [Parvularculaceae bacterium]|nr:hypothetical protein [Parvularculaceae bacterium]